MKIKKNRGNFEVNVFSGNESKSCYNNIIDKDYRKIAQILIDLYVLGFPIDRAMELFSERINKKDWLGF